MKITKHHSVGIIGGTGKTGAQFAKLFRSLGCTVSVSGFLTRARNSTILADCDIVIFSLPLSTAADTMRAELSSAKRRDQLILDVSSQKVRETKAMLTAKGEVIGMHPLFGPSTDPRGERIILCPARSSGETIRSLKTVLETMGLETTLMTPREHDTLMSTVQVLPHLKSFLMADLLRVSSTNLKKVLNVCTPSYEMEFNLIARFLDDHPDLYMPIIFRNPETIGILETLKQLIDEYLHIAKNLDMKTAEARYLECQKIFKPHLKRARTHSEACIQTLLSLTR